MRGAKTGKVQQVSNLILGYLLYDFQARDLGADALEDEYGGVSMADLKRKCFEADKTNTTVDFDLAIQALEDTELIGTGPMDVHHQGAGSSVVASGVYSKREYAYLTPKGYKAAR